ncbi:hypothetical protein JHK82_027658 [Glycine max]|nr:hypothetical protein JHK82_027658 [Glycine max]
MHFCLAGFFAMTKRVLMLGSKIGATLWQELFTELRDKLQCGSSYLVQNLRIIDNQSEYRLHDAIDKNLLLQEPLVVMLTLGKIKDATGVSGVVGEIIIDAPWSYDSCPNCTTTFDPSKGGSACRSCHTSVVDTVPRYKLNVRMEHNRDKGNFVLWDATCIKLFGKTAGECQDELIVAGDDIKVFPTCVDEILLKTWAVRFKFRSQLCQSSVLDVSEELHHIQSLIATLGLKEQSNKGKGIAVEPESSPPIFVPTSSDYDPGNSTCLTPTKRISCQQTSSDFDSDEHAQYQLSTNKHIKAE